MTHEQFEKYCKRNKPTKIVPTSCRVLFHFRKTVVIEASVGFDDELIYTKHTKAKGNSKALFTSLQEYAPTFIKSTIQKYSPKNYNKLLNQITQKSI